MMGIIGGNKLWDIRSMKDSFHGLEQIQDHFVFTCPIHDVNHLTQMPPDKTAGRFDRKVDVGAREHCTQF